MKIAMQGVLVVTKPPRAQSTVARYTYDVSHRNVGLFKSKVFLAFLAMFTLISFTLVSLNCKEQVQKDKNDGLMWYGGKPQPPINISVDYQKLLSGAGSQTFAVTLTSGVDCDHLSISLRSDTPAIQISGGVQNFGTISRGAIVSLNATISNHDTAAGNIYAHISYQKNGRTISFTKGFALKTKNASFSKSTPPGRVETTSDGRKVIIMPETTRKQQNSQ